MWTPKPKGKVIRRPKLFLKQRPGAGTGAAVEHQQQEKSDPHRESRYFGVKHTDITRIYFVDSTNSVRESPIGPFEKKQTDITAYLHAVPSHAYQTTAFNGQTVRFQGKQKELGEIRAACGYPPCRLPLSACTNSRSSRRDHPAAGAHQNENVRPTTAPTGEMRRLSTAANVAASGQTPPRSTSTIRSDTAGSKRTSCSRPAAGSVQSASRTGTRDSAGLVESVPCSTRGSVMGSVQCSSPLMTGTSCCTFGSRLQSVPE
ncbi:unnamed protein product [Calypogeia fissa]